MTKSGEMTIRDKLRLRYWTWRIQRAGLFDSAYFAAQTGLNLRSDRDAIRHCLAGAVQTTSTVHPLIEPSWIAYQSVNSDWFVALFRDRALSSSGPLFRAVRGRRSLAAELNQFLKSDSSSVSALRSCQGQETDGALEQARDELTRVAETFWEQDARSRRRNPTDWDVAGEQRFLATLDPAVEPVSTGTPLVSVIMPTFNRASLIGAAIKSVRQQTVRSWELIIVDDGSTDDTAALWPGCRVRMPVSASSARPMRASRRPATTESRMPRGATLHFSTLTTSGRPTSCAPRSPNCRPRKRRAVTRPSRFSSTEENANTWGTGRAAGPARWTQPRRPQRTHRSSRDSCRGGWLRHRTPSLGRLRPGAALAARPRIGLRADDRRSL